MEAKLDQYKLDNAYLVSQLQQLTGSVCEFVSLSAGWNIITLLKVRKSKIILIPISSLFIF